jgi:hypothetical protein
MERTGKKRRRRNWRQRGAWGLSFLGAGIVFAKKMPFSKKIFNLQIYLLTLLIDLSF